MYIALYMNIVFFNVGWMEKYKGEDEILGGGKGPQEQGWGHEVLNFETFGGKVYGYVQPPYSAKSVGQMRIERINSDYANKDEIPDVLVVWVARDPAFGGRKIVGWYKHATVYRQFQANVNERVYKSELIPYNVSADKDDVYCLPLAERIFSVPTGPGGFGQSQIWYADDYPDFKKRCSYYINNYNDIKTVDVRKTIKAYQQDQERKKLIETRAVEEVKKFYETQQFSIVTREKENIGWDLDISKGNIKFHVEVKGTASLGINVQFSPNEFEQMKQKRLDGYKVAIVTDTLGKPLVKIF
jgi:hypothetical protein